MKYLKYALAVIATLIVLFLVLGLMKPEISYDCYGSTNKSLAESWAVSQDKDKMSDWLEGFQKIEHISGVPGTVGALSDIYFISEGQEMVIRETITKINPNESVSMSFTSDFMNMEYTLNMKSYKGKTELVSNTTCRGNGIISKALIAITGNTIIEQEEKNMLRLTKAINENSKDYSNTKNTNILN